MSAKNAFSDEGILDRDIRSGGSQLGIGRRFTYTMTEHEIDYAVAVGVDLLGTGLSWGQMADAGIAAVKAQREGK